MGSLIWSLLLLQGCPQSPPSSSPSSGGRIGEIAAYVFGPDAQNYLSAPQRFPLSPEMSPAEALAALGRHLGETYFVGDDGSETAAIRFEVLNVHLLSAAQRTYRLAVINMIDPQMEALQGFFQGSAGGLTTYFLLTATFMQPQLDPPLVDGLILLYNGEAFPEIDHVNFRGIVTTEKVRPVVTNVFFRHRTEAAATG